MGRRKRRAEAPEDEGCEALQYDLFDAPTRIMAPVRPPAPRTPAGCDPFRIEGPACISFSGGRTSAYMLRRHLDAHGGRLPANVHVLFENTGKERLETLDFVRDCAERWGAYVRWLERDPDAPHGFREVDYETASRRGEPFDQLITERKFLPNRRMRFCTQELKIEVMRGFMTAEGYETWTNIVGLRRDVPRRDLHGAELLERRELAL
jgi:3'-phosphoadenosine 5'-phosphosulfate sulfotransferase (PAPS reductase)/FAD synthetase